MTGSASWLRWLLLGAAIVFLSLGFLVRGDTLATFVASLAPDGEISANTARQVAIGRVGFFVLGAALFAFAFATGALFWVLTALETLTIGIMTLVLRIGSWLGNAVSQALARLPERRSGAWPMLAIVVLVASVLALALWAQSVQPPFHAEGINLQPARNLVLHGIYATRSNLGFDLDTWKITTGPGMLIPTAVAFRLFGISMHTADMVALFFIVGFLLITYGALGRHYGYGTTVLGLFFFVFTSGNIFYGASRGYTAGSFGDAPAVFYLILGAALWGGVAVRQSSARLLFAGIAFGLAFHTKWLFLFTLPALILAWALLAIGGRRLSARTFLLPILGIGIVTAAIFAMRVE